MTKKMKVITIVGTRPEIIRLSRIMAKLDLFCEHIIVHTGQNYDYELNEIFFNDLEVRKPDHFLNASSDSTTAADTIGNVIAQSEKLLKKINPDAVLILGDTNSSLAAISAKRLKIPVFHMEAGNRCFDMRVPEEINRRIVDHTADINLPYSSIARDYLLREGLPPDLIIKTGSPMFEVLTYYDKKIESSTILEKFDLLPQKFFVVSLHREENVDPDTNFITLFNSLNDIAKKFNLPLIVSTHPRTRKRLDVMKISLDPLIKLPKPFGFLDYIKLQKNAKVVLSDSGTINEEASILKFNALNLRETYERPEAMEEARVMLVGLNSERILQGLDILANYNNVGIDTFRLVEDYSMPNVSDKIVRIILSYTDYVNRVIWKKY